MKNYLNPEKSKFNQYSIGHHFLGFVSRVEFPVLILTCFILIFLSKAQSPFISKTSNFIFSVSNPIVNAVSYPFRSSFYLIMEFKDLVEAKEQNIALRKQNDELKRVAVEYSFVKNENKELKEILNFVVPRSANITTLQIIGKAYGIFNHNFTLRKNPDQEIARGNVAIFKKSVIGRVIETVDDKAKVMLLTDSKSRIPVISEVSRNRGILAGNNSTVMEIRYLAKSHGIVPGEMIYTSADGDQVPAGILTGIVTKVSKNKVYVKMVEDISNIDRLTILQY